MFHGSVFPDKSFRSSHQRCSVKKGVLRNYTKFTGKHLCQGLFFSKVTGLRSATLLKKRLWHKFFPVNFVKFVRTPFLQNTSARLLLIFEKIGTDTLSLHIFFNYNAWNRYSCRDAFRTLSNIYLWGFFCENSYSFCLLTRI